MRHIFLTEFVVCFSLIILIQNPLSARGGDSDSVLYQTVDPASIPEGASRADLLSLSEKIEERLNQAKEYGLSENSDIYMQCREHLDGANNAIQSEDYDSATELLEKARQTAQKAIDESLPPFAEGKIARARRDLESAESNFDKKLKETPNLDAKSKELIPAIKDYVSAGKEALESASKHFAEKSYSNSLSDATEVINVSAIIEEQIRGIQGSVTDESAASGTGSDTAPATVTESEPGPEAESTESEVSESEASQPESADLTGESTSSEEDLTEESPGDAGDGSEVSRGEDAIPDERIYRVKPSDCLWRIARKKEIYGNPLKWKKIWKANQKRVPNPDKIYPGQDLVIPSDR